MPYLDSVHILTDMEAEVLGNFVTAPCTDDHVDVEGQKRKTDREASAILCKAAGCDEVQQIGDLEASQRDRAIRDSLKAGLSIRQISRLTGVNKGIIEGIRRRG